MVRVMYQYPEDPVSPAILLYGAEFLKLFPKRDIRISSPGQADTVIPVDEIICDSCNATVEVTDPCVSTEHSLYCWDCGKDNVLKHVQKNSAVALGR